MAKRASFPRVPAWPIVLAVDRFKGLPLTETQKRRIRQWRSEGPDYLLKHGRTSERTCDEWLNHLRLNWWDVWNEETVSDRGLLAEIAFAFTGETDQLELAA